jgi:hypothetical protein
MTTPAYASHPVDPTTRCLLPSGKSMLDLLLARGLVTDNFEADLPRTGVL